MQVNYHRQQQQQRHALEKLSGYQAPAHGITPDPAFNALRAARETYGADLVSLVRKFQAPENDSCGVAWLLGGGKQGIDADVGWDDLGYSVVSDGHRRGQPTARPTTARTKRWRTNSATTWARRTTARPPRAMMACSTILTTTAPTTIRSATRPASETSIRSWRTATPASRSAACSPIRASTSAAGMCPASPTWPTTSAVSA